MSGELTAIENVHEDFGWILDLLFAFAENPVWALLLGGLISLLVWRSQTRLAHSLKAKEAKRLLFREFLRQVDPAIFHNENSKVYRESRELMRLSAMQMEIELVAVRATSEAARDVVEAVGDVVSSDDYSRLVTCSDGVERPAIARISVETRCFLDAATAELR